MSVQEQGRSLQDGPYPFKHIIVILRENHTYDNYLGRFPIGNGVLLPDAKNPPLSLDPLKPPHGSLSWANRDALALQEQFSERDIALYFEWAREYGLFDNFFSAIAGPSTANHLMIITGDAGGMINNPYDGIVGKIVDALREHAEPHPPFAMRTVPGELIRNGFTVTNYGGPFFQDLAELRNSPITVPATQFELDARGGRLPSVSYLYSPTFDLNEHAPDNVTNGMNWTARQVEAVLQGNDWRDVCIIIPWDDYGGWYDHVQPRLTELWTDGKTHYRDGSRLPFLVLSAYSKPGVHSEYLTHLDIPRFVLDAAGLPPLNRRTAEARGLGSAFDLNQVPLPRPITNTATLRRVLGRDFARSAPHPPEVGMRHDQLGHRLPPELTTPSVPLRGARPVLLDGRARQQAAAAQRGAPPPDSPRSGVS